MPVEIERLRELLDSRRFSDLLIELGWDHPAGATQEVSHPDDGTIARQVATKRGIGVWVAEEIPSPGARRRLDTVVGRRNREHLLVFCEDNRQIWHWPEQRQSGTGYRLVSHEHYAGTRNEALLQRLASASFSLEEEEGLTVIDVLGRVRQSFNAEAVTKKFYNDFKTQQQNLVGKIEGIPLESDIAWYGSVLLNRLMLIYFLQKKGFLDDDLDYLRNRLTKVRERLGGDAFYGFFREFLLPLFHDGLGSHVHAYNDEEIGEIVGDVPYINGGIFTTHTLESAYPIQVPDTAFENIFNFFDQYRWHLDERPTYEPNEINPDVLGYVFEQYVNSKEKGAYYTKQDVTGHMAAITIIPAIFDRLEALTSSPWELLKSDPDRYIFESVSHGRNSELPPKLKSEPKDGVGFTLWSEDASRPYGLPAETWREAVERQDFCTELQHKLKAGEIRNTAQAITWNLDLETLAQDFLASLKSINQVEQAHEALVSLTVLDPTCGSGAFLFAALEILSDLQIILLERADELSTDRDTSPGFLLEARQHPSFRYYILRSVLLNNLYGIDLMEEATEIARLRLFLTLAAQLERKDQIEPFPDLDFNIKSGNLLVGVANRNDAEHRLATNLIGATELDSIHDDASAISKVVKAYVAAQSTSDDPASISRLRTQLAEKSDDVRHRLNQLLSESRGSGETLETWIRENRPFHWFLEFPHVFEEGGFDIVIGNPPYIQKKKISYLYIGYETSNAPDVYAACMERATSLLSNRGWYSMIVPISFQFSEQYESARKAVRAALPSVWTSTYGLWPSCLFTGVGVRNCIVTGSREGHQALRTSSFRRFHSSFRPHLFQTNRYSQVESSDRGVPWPKLGHDSLADLHFRLSALRPALGASISRRGSARLYFKSTAADFISVFVDIPPAWTLEGTRVEQTKVNSIGFLDSETRDLAFVICAGRLALWWWVCHGDDFDVTKRLISSIPISPSALSTVREPLLQIAQRLRDELPSHPLVTKKAGRLYGNYNLPDCRELTDEADKLMLNALGLEEFWPQILLADDWYQKATSESGSTKREWPFPV